MAQNTLLFSRIGRPRGNPRPVSVKHSGKKRVPSPLLYFPLEAKLLRTPFRVRVLQQLYGIARQELGNRIASVAVQASSDPDDPDQIKLLLSVWADLDKHEWHEADKAISKAVFEQEAMWTGDEKADYFKMIDFEILPLHI